MVNRYPEINMEYLTKGVGLPLIGMDEQTVEKYRQVSKEDVQPVGRTIEVPFLPVKAYGSFISSLDPAAPGYTYLADTFPVYAKHLDMTADGKFRYAYLVAEVEGYSMSPQIRGGMKVLLRRVETGDWEYAQGINAFLYNEFFIIKRITRNLIATKGVIQVVADATDEMSDIPGESLVGIWKALRPVDGTFE